MAGLCTLMSETYLDIMQKREVNSTGRDDDGENRFSFASQPAAVAAVAVEIVAPNEKKRSTKVRLLIRLFMLDKTVIHTCGG